MAGSRPNEANNNHLLNTSSVLGTEPTTSLTFTEALQGDCKLLHVLRMRKTLDNYAQDAQQRDSYENSQCG